MKYINVCIFLIMFFVYLIHLPLYDLLPRDEPRVGEIAREMALYGDWVTPRLNGYPFLEQPPLHYWLIAVSFKIGDITPFWARIPSVILAIAVSLIVFFWVRKEYGEICGITAAIVFITSQIIFKMAHLCLVDMSLCFTVACSLFLYWKAQECEKPTRFLTIPLYLMAGLSFLAKGPLGPILIGIVMLTHIIIKRGIRGIMRFHPITGIFTFAAIVSPWIIALWYNEGQKAVEIVLLRNTIGRFLPVYSDFVPPHKAPIYYYLVNIWQNVLPWSPFLPFVFASLFIKMRERKLSHLEQFVWLWTGIMFLFFSLSTGKRPYYLLPLYPGLAIGLSIIFISWLEKEWTGWIYVLRKTFLGVLIFLPPISIPIICYVMAPLSLKCGLFVVIISFPIQWWLWKSFAQKKVALFVQGFSILVLLIHGMIGIVVYPHISNKESLTPWCESVGRIVGEDKLALLDIPEMYKGALPFTLKRKIERISDSEVRKFLSSNERRYLIMSDEHKKNFKSLFKKKTYSIEEIDTQRHDLYLIANFKK